MLTKSQQKIVADFISAYNFSLMCFRQGMCTKREFLDGVGKLLNKGVTDLTDSGIDMLPALSLLSEAQEHREEMIL